MPDPTGPTVPIQRPTDPALSEAEAAQLEQTETGGYITVEPPTGPPTGPQPPPAEPTRQRPQRPPPTGPSWQFSKISEVEASDIADHIAHSVKKYNQETKGKITLEYSTPKNEGYLNISAANATVPIKATNQTLQPRIPKGYDEKAFVQTMAKLDSDGQIVKAKQSEIDGILKNDTIDPYTKELQIKKLFISEGIPETQNMQEYYDKLSYFLVTKNKNPKAAAVVEGK